MLRRVFVLRRVPADVSLWLVFFVNGAVLSSWAPRIPVVKASLGLNDSALGIALFGIAAGSVPALLLTGLLLRRVPARTVCRFSGVAFAAGLPLIPLARSLPELTAALVMLGAASGTLDVAMNTAGVQREQTLYPKRILSRLHGGYSLGVLAGAGGGTLAAAINAPVLTQFLVVSAVLVGLVALSWQALPAATSPASAPQEPVRVRIPVPVLVLCFAIGALFLEGTVTDWSALLVSRDLGGGATTGAVAVTVFSIAMAASRTWGDRLVGAIGTRRLAVGGSALAGGALAVGASQPSPVVFLVAIAVVGLGLGPQFPLAISLAGRAARGDVGAATAAVTAVGYLAYLGGPPLVGLGGDQLGLPSTIGLAAAATAAVMVGAALCRFSLPRRPRDSSAPQLPASEHMAEMYLGNGEARHDRTSRGAGSTARRPQPQATR